MRTGLKRIGLAFMLALLGAAALTGCGRKNLPVASGGSVTAPIGAPGSTDQNAPQSLANFQRTNRVTSSGGDDLRILPAEVAKNPGVPKKRFLLDGLLN
ncbi:hypothetical protein GCM10011390_36370 [Aureimonas endophytica]|uniref:Lipoprotein n=1 Tax=Aureimonas endophytica TaxID=2027858 RepID=A0A916ZUZ3_9HYPH|nr:hypothetical protein [Aureimonas endophytica]GGE13941.1 hypothetical protein GCM10011390_36370 [Aureimonas endophytica]